jgi:hypothetical protein
MTMNKEERIAQFLEQPIAGTGSDVSDRIKKEDVNARALAVTDRLAEALEKHQKPAGSFAIPEKLDKRRLEYGIPNGAFQILPAFDRVFVHQIPEDESRFYGDSEFLIKPEHVLTVERNNTPRGILVAAGLQARDALESSGIQVGDIIKFQKLAPFNMTVDTVAGTPMQVMVIRDGDVVGSEDAAEKLNSGSHSIKNVGKDGNYDFRLADNESKQVTGSKREAYYDPSM